MRRKKLRSIQSALDEVDVLGAVVLEVADARVLEEAADHRAHADVLREPATPGRSAHTPRTIRSICTPACEAA